MRNIRTFTIVVGECWPAVRCAQAPGERSLGTPEEVLPLPWLSTIAVIAAARAHDLPAAALENRALSSR